MVAKRQISVRRMLAICAMVVWGLVARAAEEVLWWQVPVNPDVTVFHQDVSTKTASVLGATDARIVTTDGTYLVIPPPDQESVDIPMGGAWYAVMPDSPEGLSFMVELGNWENDTWVGIARSQAYTYAQLVDQYIIKNWGGPEATPAIAPLVADGYVVPEPASGILLLIGGGLLALRRKRRG